MIGFLDAKIVDIQIVEIGSILLGIYLTYSLRDRKALHLKSIQFVIVYKSISCLTKIYAVEIILSSVELE